jgi:transposase
MAGARAGHRAIRGQGPLDIFCRIAIAQSMGAVQTHIREREQLVAQLRAEGLPVAYIAEALCYSASTVRKDLQRLGLTRRQCGLGAEERRARAVELRQEGLSYADIAGRLECSSATVGRYLAAAGATRRVEVQERRRRIGELKAIGLSRRQIRDGLGLGRATLGDDEQAIRRDGTANGRPDARAHPLLAKLVRRALVADLDRRGVPGEIVALAFNVPTSSVAEARAGGDSAATPNGNGAGKARVAA